MDPIEQLRQEIVELKNQLADAHKLFSNRIVIYKTLELLGKLKLKNLSADPTTGTVGEIVCVSGKLKICTADTPTWTIIGTQS